jgi:hypothetical protein
MQQLGRKYNTLHFMMAISFSKWELCCWSLAELLCLCAWGNLQVRLLSMQGLPSLYHLQDRTPSWYSLYLCRRQLHFLLDSHNRALLHWLHHLLQLEHHEAFTFTSTQVTLVLHRPPPLHPSHLLHPNAQLKNLLLQHLEHQVV